MPQELTRQKKYRSLLKVLKYVRHNRKRLYARTSYIKQIKNTKVFYMYKKQAWVVKSWFMKKYRWKSSNSSKSNDWVPKDYKVYVKKDFLKSRAKEVIKRYPKISDARFHNLDGLKKGCITKTYRRYKVGLDSYLSGTIQNTPRFYTYKTFGKEKLAKFKTLPFKLSMSRFLANKIFRKFYSHINKKSLSSIQKKAHKKSKVLKKDPRMNSIRKLRRLFIQPLNQSSNDLNVISQKIRNSQVLSSKYEKSNIIGIKKKWIQKSQQEKSKSFVTLLEQRLDSTILRLFHFKPSLIKHPFQVKQLNKLEGSFGQKKIKNRIRTNPLTSFTPLQIKQMINHGHVFVNGKKVKSGNFSLKTLDQIEVKGFISDLKKKYTKGSHELVKPTNKSLFKTEGLKRLNLIKGTLNTKKDSLKFIKSKLNKQTFSAEPSSIVEGKSLVLKSKPLLNKKESKFYKTLEKQTNTNLKVCNEGNFVLSNYVQLQKNHRKTLLLKGFENQPYLEDLNEKCKPGSEKPILPLKDGSLNISVSAEEKNIDVCEFLRLSKLKRFTEAFYITYRNLHFLERDFGLIDNTRNPKIETKRNFLKSRLEEVGQSFLKSQIEENMGPLFNRFGLDQSIYALSTLSPLLKSNNWNSSIKNGLSQSVLKREKNHGSRLRRKLRWLNRRSYTSSRFVKFIRNYYKSKSKVNRFINSKDKWQKDDQLSYKKLSMVNQVTDLSKKRPGWLKHNLSKGMDHVNTNKLGKTNLNQKFVGTEPLCYASLVYGAKSSHFIKWQQFNKNARSRLFYNRVVKGGRVSDKFNFFELELQFIQSVYESYSGYTRS